MKTVFVHPERCIGCKQCETACAVAHSKTKNIFMAVFESPAPKSRMHVESGLVMNTAFPNKCRHCSPAPCQIVCPTAAITRPADFPEIVLVQAKKCITCGMCAMVCPFDVITYHTPMDAPEKALAAIKCDHCIERQRLEQIPACVEACKVGALEFGEINELVKAARTRYSKTVVAAMGHDGTELVQLPAMLAAWRDFGAAVTHLNMEKEKECEP